MADVVYYIPDWDTHYENNRSRAIKNPVYFLCPIAFDHDGYLEFMEHPNRAAHLGAWRAIQGVAGSSRERGTLLRRGGTPHDVVSLSRRTKVPVKVLDEVIPRLLDIGWLKTQPITGQALTDDDAPIRQEGAAKVPEGCRVPATEQNRTEQNSCTPAAARSGFASSKKPPSEDNRPASVVYRLACEAEEITKCAFAPNYGRDGKHIKALLSELGEDEISERWRRFVTRGLTDTFLGSHRTVAYFCSNINSWVDAPSEFDLVMEKIRGNANPD